MNRVTVDKQRRAHQAIVLQLMRRVFVLSGLLCALATASLAAAQSAPAAVGNQITLDLRSGYITSRIPFDVPVYVTLSVDDTIRQVDVFQTERPRNVDCRTVPYPSTSTSTWTRPALAPGVAAGSTTAVNISLTPVNANRYVCLLVRFTQGLGSQSAAFTAAALSTLDDAVRPAVFRGGFTEERKRDLRGRLAQAVQAVGAKAALNGQVVLPPGSLLSASPTPAAAAQFDQFLAGVATALTNRQNILDELRGVSGGEGLVDTAATAMADWASSPAFATYAARMTANTDPAMVKRVASARLSDWLSLSSSSRAATVANARAAALGVAAGSIPQDLGDYWTPDQLDARAAAVKAWLDSLEAAAQLIKDTAPAMVAPADGKPGITSDGLTALLQLASNAYANLSPVVDDYSQLQGYLKDRLATLADVSAKIGAQVASDAYVGGSSFADFNTSANWYVSVDVGVGVAPRLQNTFPYIGTNVYFRPVNKDAPLALRGGFWRRFSVMLGTTYGTDLTGDGRENSLGSGMLLTGAGYRITDILRLSSGLMVLRAYDKDKPLSGNKTLQGAVYFSLSFDWDARGSFNKVFGTKGQPGGTP